LGLIAMSYGSIYVAQIAMGSSDAQTVKAFVEAESYPGASLIIAYSHCAMHGINSVNMRTGLNQQKLAVDSGAWMLYRYDPRLIAQGQNPLQLDSKEPKSSIGEYMYNETRFKTLQQSNPAAAAHLLELAEQDAKYRWNIYRQMAAMDYSMFKV